MSDDASTPNGDVTPNPDASAAASAPAIENVQMSKQEYAQLMSQLAAAQTQLEMMQQYSAEARGDHRTQQQQQQQIDINSLSNEQLLHLINQQISQPMLQMITQMAVKEELKEVRGKYSDFDSIKDQVYKIASANTTLSLEDAYKLAKSGQPVPPQPKVEPKEPLVPPPAQKGSTPPPSSVTASPKLSAREAAEAALKALQYE